MNNFYMQQNISNLITRQIPKRHQAKFLYLGHKMNVAALFQDDKNEPIPLNKEIFREIVGGWRTEAKIFKFYIDNGLIVQHRSYKPGERSMTYTLTPKAKESQIKKVPSSDTPLKNKIQQNKKKMECNKNPMVVKAAAANLQQIKINVEAALSEIMHLTFTQEEIDKILPKNLISFDSRHLSKNKESKKETPFYYVAHNACNNKRINKLEDSKKRKYIFFLHSLLLNAISEKDFWCFRDTTTERLHTNLTILKRELRKHISVPGKNLVNVDIANSQPLLLNTLFTGDEKYLRLCQEGLLWDYLMAKNNVTDRSEFKREMFGEVFFCQPETMLRSHKAAQFREEFPEAWRFIYGYKTTHGHEKLPIEMQKRESDIIIDTVCKELANRKTWFATIHDSVMCDVNDADTVTSLISAAFDKYGISPTCKIENL